MDENRIFFDIGLSDRPAFLIGIFFIVLDLQIFAIGLIGDILIFTHAREIKEYIIEKLSMGEFPDFPSRLFVS